MPRYYVLNKDGYISSFGTGGKTGEEIKKSEYERIEEAVNNRPTAPDGYAYRLTESLDWELYPVETPDISEDATAADYQAALAEMGVQV